MIDLDRLVDTQRRLVRVASATVPPGWSSFVLSATVSRSTSRPLHVVIDGPSPATLDEGVHDVLREIFAIHTAGGHPLRSLSFRFSLDSGGTWRAVGDFAYESP